MLSFAWARLEGPSTQVSEMPQACSACGCKEFYQQPDFKRSLGVTLVSIASVATVGLEVYARYADAAWSPQTRWLLVWSPLLFALIFDRLIIARIVPVVVSCYRCEHRFRGLTPDQVTSIEGFDLEVHDRFQYRPSSE